MNHHLENVIFFLNLPSGGDYTDCQSQHSFLLIIFIDFQSLDIAKQTLTLNLFRKQNRISTNPYTGSISTV